MPTNDQLNGNPHTNDTRNSLNAKISRLSMLGKTKKIQWGDKRRFRTI